ncbi:MAG TPA: phosphate acyltransferase PlsX, partial [Polyangia bacterium]
MRTVAVDAMGGDHAPAPEVEGAVAAVRERIARVVLVGDEARVKQELARHDAAGLDGLTVRHASEVIRMEDHPAVAAKGKKDSSMRVAFDLAKERAVDAVVSAGNSGAMLACGLFVMRRLPGVERPGIVTTFPTVNGVCALIDMGANVECRPETLAQFAVLGAVYARLLHGKPRPKVGLLSNGEEQIKGTELTRGAYKLLSAAVEKDFEFVGYVEGRDIFSGDVDVVVTDGFTGNV